MEYVGDMNQAISQVRAGFNFVAELAQALDMPPEGVRADLNALGEIASRLEGQLTATIHGTEEDLADAGELIAILERKAGRLINCRWNRPLSLSIVSIEAAP